MIKDDYSGPLDAVAWPTQLKARVVSNDTDRRIHGYSVRGDLAKHYSFLETVLLGLTGELPSAEQARAFEVALTFLAPTTVAEAPTHAALLARVCVATTSALSGAAVIGLAEQSRFDLSRYASWISWLNDESPGIPGDFAAATAHDHAALTSLRNALMARGGVIPQALALDIDETAALIAVLVACGLRTLEQIELVRTFARFPFAMAEALASPAAGHKDYPLMVPTIRYEEEVPS
ncbi:MAG: hypothetical protein ABI461_01550 [Polyangiaceae bacterium]